MCDTRASHFASGEIKPCASISLSILFIIHWSLHQSFGLPMSENLEGAAELVRPLDNLVAISPIKL